jgi:MFS superfamily sulfate permease-like transporter
MLLDDVFSLARRVSPRGNGLRWPVPRARRLAPEYAPAETRPTSISTDVLCLAPTGALSHEVAPSFVDAVLDRVAECDPIPVVVVLSLQDSPEIDDRACEALIDLHYRLRANGVRLYIGALRPAVFEHLRTAGVVARLGAEAVWPSLQTAMLAAYGELDGPAVVTREVVAALELRMVALPL